MNIFNTIYNYLFESILPLEQIPEGPFQQILKNLEPEDFYRIGAVCKLFRERALNFEKQYWLQIAKRKRIIFEDPKEIKREYIRTKQYKNINVSELNEDLNYRTSPYVESDEGSFQYPAPDQNSDSSEFFTLGDTD